MCVTSLIGGTAAFVMIAVISAAPTRIIAIARPIAADYAEAIHPTTETDLALLRAARPSLAVARWCVSQDACWR